MASSRPRSEESSAELAALPDLTFFFKARLEVSLTRILDNRPVLKFHEAGMDLNLSPDPYESFRLFQGRIFEQYLAMSTEFKFLVIDANGSVEKQQTLVRDLVKDRLNLPQFKRSERPIAKPRPKPLTRNKAAVKEEEPVE